MPSEQLQNCWVLRGIWYNQNLWLFPPSFSLLLHSDSSVLKSSPAVKSVAGNKTNFFILWPQDIRLLGLYHPIQSDIHKKNVNQPATQAPPDDAANPFQGSSEKASQGRRTGALWLIGRRLNGRSPEAKITQKITIFHLFSHLLPILLKWSCEWNTKTPLGFLCPWLNVFLSQDPSVNSCLSAMSYHFLEVTAQISRRGCWYSYHRTRKVTKGHQRSTSHWVFFLPVFDSHPIRF